MAKQAENAHQTIAAQCEPGEQLRSVGLFWEGSILAVLIWWWGIKSYWIGATDKRLIVIRLDALSRPVTSETLAVPLSAVKLQGNKILVKLPGSEKLRTFGMRFGLKSATGYDVSEFKAALNKQETN
jgi:hypothetical protein